MGLGPMIDLTSVAAAPARTSPEANLVHRYQQVPKRQFSRHHKHLPDSNLRIHRQEEILTTLIQTMSPSTKIVTGAVVVAAIETHEAQLLVTTASRSAVLRLTTTSAHQNGVRPVEPRSDTDILVVILLERGTGI